MFIVVAHNVEEIDHGPDVQSEELELLDRVETEIREVTICADLVQVHTALRKAEVADREWAVFELAREGDCSGKTVRRAVRFGEGGKTITGVE